MYISPTIDRFGTSVVVTREFVSGFGGDESTLVHSIDLSFSPLNYNPGLIL